MQRSDSLDVEGLCRRLPVRALLVLRDGKLSDRA